eukprot:588631-Prymnesium_polylepis.1
MIQEAEEHLDRTPPQVAHERPWFTMYQVGVSNVSAHSGATVCTQWLAFRARPVWRSVQGPTARPPGFLPAPYG